MCNYLNGNECKIASRIAGIVATTDTNACQACKASDIPMQPNMVTCSLAYRVNKDAAILKQYETFNPAVQVLQNGPGTELKKIIAWFHYLPDKDCDCLSRIQQMNVWGPDGCLERMPTILAWLQESAKLHNIIYVESIVKMLVHLAIKRSRTYWKPTTDVRKSVRNLSPIP